METQTLEQHGINVTCLAQQMQEGMGLTEERLHSTDCLTVRLAVLAAAAKIYAGIVIQHSLQKLIEAAKEE